MSKLLIIIFIFALLVSSIIILHKTSSGQKKQVYIAKPYLEKDKIDIYVDLENQDQWLCRSSYSGGFERCHK